MIRRLFFVATLVLVALSSISCHKEEDPFRMMGVGWHMEKEAQAKVIHVFKAAEKEPEYYHALMCGKDDWVYAASFRSDGKRLHLIDTNSLEFLCDQKAWKAERELRANLAIRKLLDDPDGYTPYQVLAKIEDILR